MTAFQYGDLEWTVELRQGDDGTHVRVQTPCGHGLWEPVDPDVGVDEIAANLFKHYMNGLWPLFQSAVRTELS